MKYKKRNLKILNVHSIFLGLLISIILVACNKSSTPTDVVVNTVESASENPNVIVLAGDTPFYVRSSKIIIATLEEAFNRLGREFKPVLLPSKRALIQANDKQVDGLLHRVANFHEMTNNQYPNLIRVESTVFSIYWTGLAKDKDIQIENWADLKNYSVGYMRGVVYVEKMVKEYVPDEQIYAAHSFEQALMMLNLGRIDVVPCARNVAHDILTLFPDKYSDIREVVEFEEIDINVFLHKDHAELAKKLSETLDIMKAEGTFQGIYETANKE